MTVLEQRVMESAATYFAKQNNKKVDWEQRRYEIAKDVLTAKISTTENTVAHMLVHPSYARFAVEYADALIAELKK